MTPLLIGLFLFLGVHCVRMLAAPWRDARIAAMGEGTWKGLYSLISALGLGLIIYGVGAARESTVGVWTPPTGARHLAALLTLPVFVLLVCAYLPGTRIKAWVGHPMLLGVVLWALAHLLANGRLVDVLLFGSFLLWSLACFVSARKRDRVAGKSYPVLGWGRDVTALILGLALWGVMAFWLHRVLMGVPPFRFTW